MKTKVVFIISFIALAGILNAQPSQRKEFSGKNTEKVKEAPRPRHGGFEASIPGLDDQQRENIKKIRMDQMKERTQISNQLKEKRAKLEVLQTADKADMKEINKVIDEIAALQAAEMKAQAAARQKIRNILTEEQRIIFDSRPVAKEARRMPERPFGGQNIRNHGPIEGNRPARSNSVNS